MGGLGSEAKGGAKPRAACASVGREPRSVEPRRAGLARNRVAFRCGCKPRETVGDLDQVARLRSDLDRAIDEEDYEKAAGLRDELRRLTEADQVQIADANRRFYEAFEKGSMSDMARVWGSGAHCRVVHPGSGCILGREDVLTSWKHIFTVGGYKIDVRDVKVHALAGGSQAAMVTCVEHVDSGATSGTIVATNVFEKQKGEWKLVHHHGSSSTVQLEENPWTM